MNESTTAGAATKKAYAAPTLVRYGSIAKLTLIPSGAGKGGTKNDGQGMPDVRR